ncbi:MAG: hypothetical protein DRQ55_12740 [Planctomycetota bacterium]|nr:MAG: hypothetical protein DRQ55_12740 [Planctomycetota bacterium]
MKLLILLLLALAACAPLTVTDEEYDAAKYLIAQHAHGREVDPVRLAEAERIVAIRDDPGTDWPAVGWGALSMLGLALAGPRGRAVVAAGARAVRHGDLAGLASAGMAYVGARSSQPVLAKHGPAGTPR